MEFEIQFEKENGPIVDTEFEITFVAASSGVSALSRPKYLSLAPLSNVWERLPTMASILLPPTSEPKPVLPGSKPAVIPFCSTYSAKSKFCSKIRQTPYPHYIV